MEKCKYCGEEIEFRNIYGVNVPFHVNGVSCIANDETQDLIESSTCKPTRCPKCGQPTFFIRHNGGSVWVDELGDTWPKHPCMDSSQHTTFLQNVPEKLDVIFRGFLKFQKYHEQDLSKIYLAIDGNVFDKGRVIVSTDANLKIQDFTRKLVFIDFVTKKITVDGYGILPLYGWGYPSASMNLNGDWFTIT